MSDHTPGPYLFEPHNMFGAPPFEPEDGPWPFGYLSSMAHGMPSPIFELRPVVDTPVEELTAVAQLISAAAEMLTALEWCVEIIQGDADQYDKTRGHPYEHVLSSARAAIAKASN